MSNDEVVGLFETQSWYFPRHFWKNHQTISGTACVLAVIQTSPPSWVYKSEVLPPKPTCSVRTSHMQEVRLDVTLPARLAGSWPVWMWLTVLSAVLPEVCSYDVPHQDDLAAPNYPVLELPAVASVLTWLTEAPAFVFPAMNGTTSPVKFTYSWSQSNK